MKLLYCKLIGYCSVVVCWLYVILCVWLSVIATGYINADYGTAIWSYIEGSWQWSDVSWLIVIGVFVVVLTLVFPWLKHCKRLMRNQVNKFWPIEIDGALGKVQYLMYMGLNLYLSIGLFIMLFSQISNLWIENYNANPWPLRVSYAVWTLLYFLYMIPTFSYTILKRVEG